MDKFDDQCRQCIRSSIVIDALCDKIKALESQIARVSSEAFVTDLTPPGRSFSSNSNLIEPTAKDHTYVLSAVTRNDSPLIDLLDNGVDGHHDALSGDKAAIFRPDVTSTAIDLSCNVHSFSYIQHFAKPSIESKSLSEVRGSDNRKIVGDSKSTGNVPAILTSAVCLDLQSDIASSSNIQAKPEIAICTSSNEIELERTAPTGDSVSANSSSTRLSGTSNALGLSSVPCSEIGQAAVGRSHQDNTTKKQPKLLTGLEHSIWAPKPAEKASVPDDPLLKPERVSNEDKVAKEPLNAQNRSTHSLEETEAQLDKPNNHYNYVQGFSTGPLEKTEAQLGKVNNHLNETQRAGSSPGYPMGYIPSAGDRDVYRTVFVSGLKPSFSMSQVLSQVQGGIVVDAKLMNTSKLIGSNSALVTFLHQSSAKHFENHARKRFLEAAGLEVTVYLLTTPTWPLAKGFELVIRGQGHSRCLRLLKCPNAVSAADLRKHLEGSSTTNMSNIEDIIFDPDGTVEIRFSSINAAQQAFGILTALRYATNGRKIEYGRDPCAQPLKDN